MVYVALLRGINVGGANMVNMRELKSVFEEAGMERVRTYINSGNVVFSAAESDRATLTRRLQAAVSERFGFEASLLVRDADEIRSIAEALPDGWANNETMKCDVLYLWDDVDDPGIVGELPIRPELEDTIYTPGAVIRRIDRKNATKSRLPKIVGTPLYQHMTVRNCNTARKLAKLVEG